jgi:hypothetical protein
MMAQPIKMSQFICYWAWGPASKKETSFPNLVPFGNARTFLLGHGTLSYRKPGVFERNSPNEAILWQQFAH